jgi:hypothetical protein
MIDQENMKIFWNASDTLKLTFKKNIRIVEDIFFLQPSIHSSTFQTIAGQISKHVDARPAKFYFFLMYERTFQKKQQQV